MSKSDLPPTGERPRDASALEPIRTGVARAEFGDNQFCGHAVNQAIAGKADFWSVWSLAVGHRMLTADESGIVDDLYSCHMVGDPRIWPLKATRLVASYGGSIAGFAAGLSIADSSRIGPGSFEHAARFLARVREVLGDAAPTCAAVLEAFERMHLDRILPGFGVAFRPTDERLPPFFACLERRRRANLPHARLMFAMIDAVRARFRLEPNIAIAAGATLLDVGFTPAQVGLVTPPYSIGYFLANAVEGAEQRAPVLRALPDISIRYVGPAPRQSRRSGGR